MSLASGHLTVTRGALEVPPRLAVEPERVESPRDSMYFPLLGLLGPTLRQPRSFCHHQPLLGIASLIPLLHSILHSSQVSRAAPAGSGRSWKPSHIPLGGQAVPSLAVRAQPGALVHFGAG